MFCMGQTLEDKLRKSKKEICDALEKKELEVSEYYKLLKQVLSDILPALKYGASNCFIKNCFIIHLTH